MKKTTVNNKYLNELKNTFIDKAFFVEKLPENINIILDYGCADGSFLMFLRKIYGEKYKYIGIEPNADFYRIAKANKLEVYENFHNFYKNISKDLYSNICINFSSSLHEIYNGAEFNFIVELMEVYKFGAISIRDMNVQIMDEVVFEEKYCSDVKTFIINMMNIFIRRKTSQKLSQFVTIKPIDNLEDIVHFLLKYFYDGDDWIRELNENYLCTTDKFQNTLDLYSEFGYELIWQQDYNLPYLITKWMKDHMLFDFDRDYPWFTTHSQYLFVKKGDS